MDRVYTANGLNQYGTAGATSLTHDANGNTSGIGSDSYTYSSENLLKTGPGSVTLSYDPMLRLYETSAGRRFAYDGGTIVAEYDTSDALQARHVFGPNPDEVLVTIDAGGNRSWPVADERGSIVAKTDASGAATAIMAYDEYGIPSGSDVGRFRYTGQAWLAELGFQYYKARMYSPTLGRFLQTDPIGYADGMNLYAYVGNDPVNAIDPSGTCERPNNDGGGCADEIVVEGHINPLPIGCVKVASCGWSSIRSIAAAARTQRYNFTPYITVPTTIANTPQSEEEGEEIVVTGARISKVNDWPQTRIDPRNYPRVEACIKFAHECLAQPSTVTPNAKGQCLGAELMCYAESYLRGRSANDRRSFDYCHNYSCFYVAPNGRVTFYDKRYNR